MTIAVAVSGGADSLYAMASLQREYPGQVIAFHALQKETSPEDDPVPGLEASCRALGVPLHILDLQEAFLRTGWRPVTMFPLPSIPVMAWRCIRGLTKPRTRAIFLP